MNHEPLDIDGMSHAEIVAAIAALPKSVLIEGMAAYELRYRELSAEAKRLRAKVDRVSALIPQWHRDRAGYPTDTGRIEAKFAYIAVSLCEKELRDALTDPPEPS